MAEGSSRLAYRVRAALAGLLESSDAILRRRGLVYVLCTVGAGGEEVWKEMPGNIKQALAWCSRARTIMI